ncbi:uncharacterized protein GGS25DRAFT_480890, partial [Hypoxylon fragiforme]|uniref:uncharacterized protein n=1 Tax=Hypoxylon fragiforme TaxID=63214 RepID=UPI0020C7169E
MVWCIVVLITGGPVFANVATKFSFRFFCFTTYDSMFISSVCSALLCSALLGSTQNEGRKKRKETIIITASKNTTTNARVGYLG